MIIFMFSSYMELKKKSFEKVEIYCKRIIMKKKISLRTELQEGIKYATALFNIRNQIIWLVDAYLGFSKIL